ncbi:hypothetical protein [Microbacterium stercoris]|uniref:Uncharacterized protein n=1 Tax=Microbacterium stercoris TaxID=2820289 RepID=A0A939TV73_9MICO|nr:hypothetical protein [Microbacterium stercoris]MBO3664799.1 hypothetical protein [Microbacterium stercoris]
MLAPVTDSHCLTDDTDDTDYIAQMSDADAGGMWPTPGQLWERVAEAKTARA